MLMRSFTFVEAYLIHYCVNKNLINLKYIKKIKGSMGGCTCLKKCIFTINIRDVQQFLENEKITLESSEQLKIFFEEEVKRKNSDIHKLVDQDSTNDNLPEDKTKSQNSTSRKSNLSTKKYNNLIDELKLVKFKSKETSIDEISGIKLYSFSCACINRFDFFTFFDLEEIKDLSFAKFLPSLQIVKKEEEIFFLDPIAFCTFLNERKSLKIYKEKYIK